MNNAYKGALRSRSGKRFLFVGTKRPLKWWLLRLPVVVAPT